MEMKVLCVGDVVGTPGLERLRKSLRKLKNSLGADFVIVNGENASGVGLTPNQAEDIFDSGADCITLGNHTYSRREICDYLDETKAILRPANYAPQVPGHGWAIFESKYGTIAVVDLIGRCGMDYSPDNPFLMIDKILPKLDAKFIFVEIHAEATSEKLAMGHMLDGRACAVWGTHTHVPTADAQVLPKGTGFVTDLGMTGPKNSILGVKIEQSVSRFRGNLPTRYQWAEGPTKLEAALFTIDTNTAKCVKAERVDICD